MGYMQPLQLLVRVTLPLAPPRDWLACTATRSQRWYCFALAATRRIFRNLIFKISVVTQMRWLVGDSDCRLCLAGRLSFVLLGVQLALNRGRSVLAA